VREHWLTILERVKGIEPSYEAWEAAVLPLNYTRVEAILASVDGGAEDAERCKGERSAHSLQR
jgi:hypothetical protein